MHPREPGQRLHDERAFLDGALGRSQGEPCGRHELVVAAAGMDRIVNQRLAVRRERDAPGQAVQPAGQQVQAAARRTLGEPHGVDELQEQLVVIARVCGVHVHHRVGAVDLGQA